MKSPALADCECAAHAGARLKVGKGYPAKGAGFLLFQSMFWTLPRFSAELAGHVSLLSILPGALGSSVETCAS